MFLSFLFSVVHCAHDCACTDPLILFLIEQISPSVRVEREGEEGRGRRDLMPTQPEWSWSS